MRSAALDDVLINYPALTEAFDTLDNESHDDYDRKANGIFSHFECFDSFFGLKLSRLVFSATEQTSIALQGKSTTVRLWSKRLS